MFTEVLESNVKDEKFPVLLKDHEEKLFLLLLFCQTSGFAYGALSAPARTPDADLRDSTPDLVRRLTTVCPTN